MQLSLSNIAIPNGEENAVYALLQKYGFTGLEIAPTKLVGENPYGEDNIKKAKEIAKLLEEQYNLCIPSMQSIWFGMQGNIFEETQAQELINYTKKAVQFAKAVGCKSLVFGCPRNRTMPQGKTLQDVVPFFAQIAQYAQNNQTAIALEANPPLYNTNFINTTCEAFALAQKIDALRVNYDVGTCIINAENFESLTENLAKVSHIHVSEPNLALIEPRALHKDLAVLLRQHQYKGFVSVEMKEQTVPEIEKTLAYMQEVFA